MENKLKYSCGCDRTDFLCPEAVRLWQRVGDAYKYAQYEQSVVAWRSYDKARLNYDKHFRQPYTNELKQKARVDYGN